MRAGYLAAVASALSVVTACSSSDSPPSAETQPAAETNAVPPSKLPARACDLVTGEEMSAILGGKVVPKGNDNSSGKTLCIYTAAEGISPYAEFSVEWGSGESAMAAAGMMNRREPGIADPYEGIGDQAVSVGPALMIRSGEDLITLAFSGVEDVPGKARKIYDTAKARL